MRVGMFAHEIAAGGCCAHSLVREVALDLVRCGHEVDLWIERLGSDCRLPEAIKLHVWPRPGRRMTQTRRKVSSAAWAEAWMARSAPDVTVSFSTLAGCSNLILAGPTHAARHLHEGMAGRNSLRGRAGRLLSYLNPDTADLLATERMVLQSGRVRRLAMVGVQPEGSAVRHASSVEVHSLLSPLPTRSFVEGQAVDADMARRRFSIAPERPVLIAICRDAKLDPPDGLLRAFAAMLEDGTGGQPSPPPVLVMHGKVLYRHQRLAEALGVRESVRFTGSSGSAAGLLDMAAGLFHPTWLDTWATEVRLARMKGVPAWTTRFSAAARDNHVLAAPDPLDVRTWRELLGQALPENGQAGAGRSVCGQSEINHPTMDEAARMLADWALAG